MKKQSQVGLVIEGNSTASTILRLPNLDRDLGPVKSGSLRAARRFSNTIRAGYPVLEYEDLQTAGLVLIHLPDNTVAQIVADLCTSGLVMKGMTFVLCESWFTTDILRPLADRGACTATLKNLPTTQRDWFAVEGATRAVRQTRRFLTRNGARSNELKPGSKDLLFASELMATALPIPILMSAQQALRASGFSGNVLSTLLEQMLTRMLQEFLRGARAAWGGPLTECSPELSSLLLQTLEYKNPPLAAYLNEQISLARKIIVSARPLPELANTADAP